LVFWWFVLVDPLTSLLRASVQIVGSMIWGRAASQLIKETPTGDWGVEFPLDFSLPQSPLQARQVHSVGFDIPRSSVISFTFGLPVFWALMLAAWRPGGHWRGAFCGKPAVPVVWS